MPVTRRKLIFTGLAATAGATGVATAYRLAAQHGLIAPDHSGLYGPGETLTYATHRLLSSHSLVREYPSSAISKPFAKGKPPKDPEFQRLQTGGFTDWKLTIDGLVARPGAFSLGELKSLPAQSQITHMACEEGWSFIAQWTGVPLAHVLNAAGILPQARFVVYSTIQRARWDSLDLDDALHPQTLVSYAMNGADLSVGHGGPLRMRVPRYLGYKNLKFLTHLTVTDSLKNFGKGLGSASSEGGYAWYAGV